MNGCLIGISAFACWPVIPAALAMVVIARGVWQARGCTLVAPLLWALVSIGVLAAAEATERETFGFVAATSTFCPIVALLGAKQPQSRPWQLIVLALWFVTALPALESMAVRPGDPLSVHAVWGWFYAILIAVGAINYLPTRFGAAGLLAAAGQVCLMWRQLPISALVATQPRATAGLALLSSAVAVAGLCSRGIAGRRPADDWNRVWRHFRDCYGMVWALRVMERVNSIAASDGAPVVLHWHGFGASDRPDQVAADRRQPASAEVMARIEPTVRQLLLRFVSARWIDARRKPPAQAGGE